MNRIFAFGDIHGNLDSFYNLQKQLPADIDDTDIVIMCGDVGFEYGNYRFSDIKKAMRKLPCDFLILRGNHDNRYWRDHVDYKESYSGNILNPDQGWNISNKYEESTLVQVKYPNIHYIKDEGGIYYINDKSYLMIPGAYSVDKYYRLDNHLSYEPQEQLSYIEQLQLYNNLEVLKKCVNDIEENVVDYIIAHTCPLSQQINIKDLFLSFIDQSTVDNSMEKWIDDIIDLIDNRFIHYYFGHYHSDRSFGKYTMLYHQLKLVDGEMNNEK